MFKILFHKKYRLTTISIFVSVLMVMVAQFALQNQALFNADVRNANGVGEVAIGGPFELVDTTGIIVTEAILQDKFTLIFFGFTFCPDICPDALSKAAEMYDTLNETEQQAFQVVMISVDPARDTVASMKDYVKAFHEDFIGLTGTEEQVQAAIDAYKVYAVKALNAAHPEDYLVNHSGWFYLMDPRGKYAKHFSHSLPVAEIEREIRAFF